MYSLRNDRMMPDDCIGKHMDGFCDMLNFDPGYGYGSGYCDQYGYGDGSGCRSGCGFMTARGYGTDMCGPALRGACMGVTGTTFIIKEYHQG